MSPLLYWEVILFLFVAGFIILPIIIRLDYSKRPFLIEEDGRTITLKMFKGNTRVIKFDDIDGIGYINTPNDEGIEESYPAIVLKSGEEIMLGGFFKYKKLIEFWKMRRY